MLIALNPIDPQHHRDVANIWSNACGNCYSISPDFVRYNLDSVAGLLQAGRFTTGQTGTPAGFVIASVLKDDPIASPPTHGWIEAVAVLPEHQNCGQGDRLMSWAEQWLIAQGCNQTRLGAGMHAFTPGLPLDLPTERFFIERGYRNSADDERILTWDVASDLAGYEPPAAVREIDGIVRPATPEDIGNLKVFLQREFPDRWRFETEDFVNRGGRISDFMLLWTDRGVDGFCWLTFEDSKRPLERYYPYGLPRSWGQLGPIGVSEDRRGRGYGAAILDAGLRRLRDNGVRGCVIDWTGLLDFYSKFGFSPYREYLPMSKNLV